MSATQTRNFRPDDLFRLALEERDRGRSELADRYITALTDAGQLVRGAVNHAMTLWSRGHYHDAERVLKAGLQLAPGSTDIEGRLGLLLLLLGRWPEAWPLYESRPVHINANVCGKPRLSFPEWQGEPVGSLLVLPEQGLGDQIQFARYALELKRRGMDVSLVCHPHLVRLLEPLGVRLIPAAGAPSLPKADAWALLMSLPYRMGSTPDHVPPAPYLPSRSGGRGIGLMLAGSPGHVRDERRSLPQEFAEQLLAMPGSISLEPTATGARDFEDTARIVDGLELVITVDTSVAHLAGAMGKPVWILLSHVADWRWLTGRDSTPWYPGDYILCKPADWG